LRIGDSATIGPEDARITIVDFCDYASLRCSQSNALLDRLLREYPRDVRRVHKHFAFPGQFAIPSMYEAAVRAAKASLAAGEQGKLWQMHEKLYTQRLYLPTNNYDRWAREIGLDVTGFDEDMMSTEVQARIDREIQDGRDADVTDTPAIFMNGRRREEPGLAGWKATIDAALNPRG
jgi:protein-disulfide isomerase